MKASTFKNWIIQTLLVFILGFVGLSARAADFAVTSPGFFFNINGSGNGQNPTITLVRGKTYTFAVSTTAGTHPFNILAGVGLSNNNITSGTITFVVPTNAVNYTYECSIHHFTGTILTIAPPTPLPPKILTLTVGTNLNLKFTGSNTFSYFPEFNTNLSTTNWFALTIVQTNAAPNGTNDVICGLPSANRAFIRVRAQ